MPAPAPVLYLSPSASPSPPLSPSPYPPMLLCCRLHHLLSPPSIEHRHSAVQVHRTAAVVWHFLNPQTRSLLTWLAAETLEGTTNGRARIRNKGTYF